MKELEQGSKQKGPPRARASGKLQQQRPPGVKEQKTGTAGVERDPEAPATEAFRSKGRQGRDFLRSYRNEGLQEQGKEKQGQPKSGVYENSQQQGPPGEKREAARDSRGERARNKIKGLFDVDALDTTEGRGEDLKKYSKEEGNEAKHGVAEARRENTDKPRVDRYHPHPRSQQERKWIGR